MTMHNKMIIIVISIKIGKVNISSAILDMPFFMINLKLAYLAYMPHKPIGHMTMCFVIM